MSRTKDVRPAEFIFSFLKNGASADMAVDGSGTAVNFKYTWPVARL